MVPSTEFRRWLPQVELFLQPISAAYFLPLLVLLVTLCYRRMALNRKPRRLPPSPRKLPIIGNIHHLSSLPHRSLRVLSQTHGPVMLLHLGQVPILVVSSAEAAREVLKTQDLVFATRPFSLAADLLSYGSRNVAFCPYGEHWRQAKKAVVVHLLAPNKVKSFRQVREEEVAVMMEKIAGNALSSSSSAVAGVDLSEIFHCFSGALVTRHVVGNCLAVEEKSKMFRDFTAEGSAIIAGLTLAEAFPSLAWLYRLLRMDSKLLRFFKKWDAFLDEVVNEHEQPRERLSDETAVEDFVDVLLSIQRDSATNFSISRSDIKAITMDLVAAGSDTSYTVLEWAMAEIVRNPETLEKARKEVREVAGGKPMVTEDDVSRMSYLKAVTKEVFRLHPPAPLLLPREAMEDTRVLGYDIPRKTRVFVNAWAIGRDPASWEAPENFRPERFLDSQLDFRGNDFEFIPFGGGRRVCPGINFAVAGIELALANLLNRFDWALPGAGVPTADDWDMEELPGITVRRKSGLRLVAIPRVPCPDVGI